MALHRQGRLVSRARFVRRLRSPMLTAFACAGVACTATNPGMEPDRRWLDITAPRSGQEAEVAEARYDAWRLEANAGLGISSSANSAFGLALGKRVSPAIEVGLAFSQATYDIPEPFSTPFGSASEEVEQETALATIRLYLEEIAAWEPWLQVGLGHSWSDEYNGFQSFVNANDLAISISAGASYPLTDSITFEPSLTNVQAVEDITTFQIAIALNF